MVQAAVPQGESQLPSVDENKFLPFVSKGTITVGGSEPKSVQILRDTGSVQSLMLESCLPVDTTNSATGEYVIIKGIEGGSMTVPLHKIMLECSLVVGEVE